MDMAKLAAAKSWPAPSFEDVPAFDPTQPTDLAISEIGTVIYATGYRPDFNSWLPWQDAFDDYGFPFQKEGSSTVVPGLHFLGLHFLRKRKSSLLTGVGEDAGFVASTIAARHVNCMGGAPVASSG